MWSYAFWWKKSFRDIICKMLRNCPPFTSQKCDMITVPYLRYLSQTILFILKLNFLEYFVCFIKSQGVELCLVIRSLSLLLTVFSFMPSRLCAELFHQGQWKSWSEEGCINIHIHTKYNKQWDALMPWQFSYVIIFSKSAGLFYEFYWHLWNSAWSRKNWR